MAGRVAVLSPEGQFGTVDAADAEAVVKAGGKVLSKAQIDEREAQQRQDEAYEKTGTVGKIAGAVGTAAGVLNPLMMTGAPGTSAAAVNKGVQQGLGAGIVDAGVRQGLDRVAPGAGHKYAQQVDDARLANSTAYGAGEIMGLAAGTALPVTPAGMIGKAGGLAERGAAFATRGLADGGALARATVTGAKMGARGAVEAGAYGGVSYAANQVLHDEEINGEKLLSVVGHSALAGAVLGGGLGATGSLAASGAKAAGRSLLRKLAAGADGGAARSGANALAFDSLGTTRKIADKINTQVEGGTKAVGDYMNRRIREPQSLMQTTLSSRADEALPLIQADKAKLGGEIGDVIKGRPLRIHVDEAIAKPATAILDAMEKDPTLIQGAPAFKARIAQTVEAFNNAGKIAPDGTMSLSDLYYARANMERVAHELGPKSAAQQSFKSWLRQLDDTLVTKLDDAAKLVGEADGAKLRGLKRDYHLASWAERAAQDGSNRIAGNNIFGLREAMIGGSAIGGALVSDDPVGGALKGVALTMGGRFVRQRGAAIAARALTRAADSAAVQRLLVQADTQVASAAKGVLREAPPAAERVTSTPKRTPAAEAASKVDSKAETLDMRRRADAIVKWHAELQSNPQKVLDEVQEAAEIVGRSAGPRAASQYTAMTMKALTFVAKYIPPKERRDPLDPRSVPPLTYDEADRLNRAHAYAADPPRIWKDLERGHVTPEVIDAAQTFAPDQFDDFRAQLLGHVTDHMMNNRQLTQTQRLRLDKLGIQAFRPDSIARYQANFMQTPPDSSGAPKPAATGAPVKMNVQQSGFDAVEARKTR